MTKPYQTFITCMIAAFAVPALAQPPGGPPDGGPGGRGPGGRGGGSNNAVLSAIDADGNHEISAAEMKNAMAALATLDTNKDGKLVRDEIHPEFAGRDRDGRGGPGGPGGERGGRDGGGDDLAERLWGFDSNKDGNLDSDELPDRMRIVLARHDENKNGSLEKAEIEKMIASRHQERGGQGGRGRGGPEARGGPEGHGGPGGRGGDRGGPPGPEQLVTDAMEFDADKDGKLSKAELTKFAEEFASRGPGGRGRGPGGDRGGFGGRVGGAGDRPQRPARPE